MRPGLLGSNGANLEVGFSRQIRRYLFVYTMVLIVPVQWCRDNNNTQCYFGGNVDHRLLLLLEDGGCMAS